MNFCQRGSARGDFGDALAHNRRLHQPRYVALNSRTVHSSALAAASEACASLLQAHAERIRSGIPKQTPISVLFLPNLRQVKRVEEA
jgi:hypothetical protein